MVMFFRKLKIIFIGFFIFYLFFLVFPQHYSQSYAAEGDPCCTSGNCGFGYTCVNIPSACNIIQNPGICVQSQQECNAFNHCPSGYACVDYVCVPIGGGSGGGVSCATLNAPACGTGSCSGGKSCVSLGNQGLCGCASIASAGAGNVDGYSCTNRRIEGWAVWEGHNNEVWVSGVNIPGGDYYYQHLQTYVFRDDINILYNITGNHGFHLYFSASWLDGNSRTIKIYGSPFESLIGQELPGSPITITCAAPTSTPTPTPWVRVNVKDSGGVAVNSSQICGVDCSGTVCVKKTGTYCSANDNSFTFSKFTATNTYLGGRIELTNNLLQPLVVVGVIPSVAGFSETTCNGIGGYCYVWNKNSWTTGGRTVDFVVAIPTNTPTPN